MITPQDIKEKTFEKAVFGGYGMTEVDTFLEEIASDLALLQKENATLKAKMKVLVDKVEEYRSNEDAIRMAVVSAQRLGNILESEAKEKAAAILAQAEAESARITKDSREEVLAETARLDAAKQASARFVEDMALLCGRQQAFLEKVAEMDFVKEVRAARTVEPAPAEDPDPIPAEETPAAENNEIHETVKSIEETIAKVADDPINVVHPVIQPAPAVDELPTKAYSFVTDSGEDLAKTTQFSFDDLNK